MNQTLYPPNYREAPPPLQSLIQHFVGSAMLEHFHVAPHVKALANIEQSWHDVTWRLGDARCCTMLELLAKTYNEMLTNALLPQRACQNNNFLEYWLDMDFADSECRGVSPKQHFMEECKKTSIRTKTLLITGVAGLLNWCLLSINLSYYIIIHNSYPV